jgi:hypothetical protein
MTDPDGLEAWVTDAGPLGIDVESGAGKVKLTFTVTTNDGDLEWITVTTNEVIQVLALIEALDQAAQRMIRP